MTEYMIEAARRKVEKNRDYMQTHGVEVSGKVIPFADFVQNSYVNANRYVAEINNRVYSLNEYAHNRSLVNVFFTLTLPSLWHPTKKTRSGKRVPNPKFGGRYVLATLSHPLTGDKIKLLNPEDNKARFTPRKASKELTKLLKKLFDDRLYKSIDKDDRVYFRVTEPHKDGTPHIHVSFFVPEHKADAFADTLCRLYPSPMGSVEQNVVNPVAYLMKYVLKTLDDLRGGDDISALTLWYIHHGIGRIYTSRTLIDLQTYRALGGRYDMIELTHKYRDNQLTIMLDKETNKITQIFDEFGLVYNKKHVRVSDSKQYEAVPNKWKDLRPKFIPVEIDGEHFHYHPRYGLKEEYVPAGHMSDFELYQHFEALDIETVNLHHYGYVKNELIERGYLQGEPLPINAYDSMEWGF